MHKVIADSISDRYSVECFVFCFENAKASWWTANWRPGRRIRFAACTVTLQSWQKVNCWSGTEASICQTVKFH